MRATTARWGLALVLSLSALPVRAQNAPGHDVDHSNTRQRPAAKPPAGGGALVSFGDAAPFPFQGLIPEQNKPFLDHDPDGRAFHLAPRGGKLYEDQTYSDRRSLLVVPRAFDPRKPDAAIVVFFHGNLATLARDVVQRQRVPAQLEASGMNAVLVAPQLAVDALDSSPGRFYDPGFFDSYLDRATTLLAARSKGRFDADQLAALPVVIVAYSGGYLATAFTLKYAAGAARHRIAGVILLDALFGEDPKFTDWIARAHDKSFFVSAYSDASAGLNGALADRLAEYHIAVQRTIPPTIAPGAVVLQAVPGAVHNDFVTRAWGANPLQALLGRIRVSR